MSYNIQHGRGMDGEVDLERIAQVILEHRADLVALQEVDVGVERSGRIDIVTELATLTGMEHYTFGKNIDHEGGDYGNATLSRVPILQQENTHFDRLGPEQRGVLQTVIEVAGRRMLLMNTHLDHRRVDEERLLYIREVRERILPRYIDDVDAVIFAGDFNDLPGSAVHERIKEYMTDAWEVVGRGEGFTIPPDEPRRRIDYIFYSGNVEPVFAHVPITMASDHLPLVVEFRLNGDDSL